MCNHLTLDTTILDQNMDPWSLNETSLTQYQPFIHTLTFQTVVSVMHFY